MPMGGSGASERDPDWRNYPDTVLWFQSAPPLRVDLRSALSERERRAFADMGLHGTFAVITAFDPLGHDLPRDENMMRAESLERRLTATREVFVRVDACSPDRSHCEASLAWKTGLQEASRLARELEQIGFFWFDAEIFWIIAAAAGTDPIALPRTGA